MSLKVFVQSPDTFGERRFDPEITIEALKHKLEGITGISFRNQRLVLYQDVDSAEALGQPVCVMEDEQGTLSRYGVQEYQCIKVENTDPNAREGGEFTDVSQVEKFELTREEYESRPDTVLNALKARSLGRFAPPSTPSSSSPASHNRTPDQVVGARCIVTTDETTAAQVEKRGIIRFVGETSFGDGKGEWIGIELDEPVGKNDGSVAGQRYFTSGPKRGVFVRPNKVQVGDYPEVDEFADSEDEI